MSGAPSSWILTGSGKPKAHRDCGKVRTWVHSGPDGDHWRRGRRGCGTFDCPIDLSLKDGGDTRWRNGWSSRQARRIERRFQSNTAQHFVLSPPANWEAFYKAYFTEKGSKRRTPLSATPERWRGPCHAPESPEDVRRLRAFGELVARAVGISKASLIIHPERCVRMDRRGGHDGFHFHGQTPCRIDPVRVMAINKRTGWFVRGLGFKPVYRVAIYELHHAGRVRAPSNAPSNNKIRYSTEAVSWFGKWDKSPEPDRDGIPCPVCYEIVPVRDWHEAEWIGQGPPPEGRSGTGGEWRRAEPLWRRRTGPP